MEPEILKRIERFEEKIGYSFKNKDLIFEALSHSSFANEYKHGRHSNERLEFLGDAFLDAIIGVELFHRMADESEGRLTKTRALIVCEKALADAARKIELGRYLNMGHGEEIAGGRTKDSILADAAEAVIGALFLDGGYEAAQSFVLRFFEETIREAVDGRIFLDYKSEVQEILQGSGVPVNISYITDREEGPAHDKRFTVDVVIDSIVYGTGIGTSKKEAEQEAAKVALNKLAVK